MASRPPGAPFQAQGAPAMQNRPMQGVPGLPQPNAPAQMQRTGNNSMNPLAQPVGPIHGPVNPSAQSTPVTPTQRPSSATFNAHSGTPGPSNITSIASADSISSIPQSEGVAELAENVLDQDVQGIKRKMEFDEGGNKRTRQKTGKLSFNPVLTAKSKAYLEPPDSSTVRSPMLLTFPMFNGICSCRLPLAPQGSLPKNQSDSLFAKRLNMFLLRVRLVRMAVEI